MHADNRASVPHTVLMQGLKSQRQHILQKRSIILLQEVITGPKAPSKLLVFLGLKGLCAHISKSI